MTEEKREFTTEAENKLFDEAYNTVKETVTEVKLLILLGMYSIFYSFEMLHSKYFLD